MAKQDEKDGGKTRDFLHPVTSPKRKGKEKKFDPVTGLPILDDEQQKLLERLVRIETDRMRSEDQDRTDY